MNLQGTTYHDGITDTTVSGDGETLTISDGTAIYGVFGLDPNSDAHSYAVLDDKHGGTLVEPDSPPRCEICARAGVGDAVRS